MFHILISLYLAVFYCHRVKFIEDDDRTTDNSQREHINSLDSILRVDALADNLPFEKKILSGEMTRNPAGEDQEAVTVSKDVMSFLRRLSFCNTLFSDVYLSSFKTEKEMLHMSIDEDFLQSRFLLKKENGKFYLLVFASKYVLMVRNDEFKFVLCQVVSCSQNKLVLEPSKSKQVLINESNCKKAEALDLKIFKVLLTDDMIEFLNSAVEYFLQNIEYLKFNVETQVFFDFKVTHEPFLEILSLPVASQHKEKLNYRCPILDYNDADMEGLLKQALSKDKSEKVKKESKDIITPSKADKKNYSLSILALVMLVGLLAIIAIIIK